MQTLLIITAKFRLCFNMRASELILVYMVLIFLHQNVVFAQGDTTERVVLSPLALGGMVQGLLGMQIRPEGGFYEERYKDIFHDEINVPLATNIDRHSIPSFEKKTDIFSEDGKSLTDAAEGKSPNPCFDQERIVRNRLLLLVCSLQQLNQQVSNN